jgi:hypothetical protein
MAVRSPGAGLIEPLTWEDLADGSVHRLKRGKHFRGDVRQFAKVAALEAERMGKAVRTMRDEFGKLQYLWLQFAHFQLPVGAPCPNCGSMTVVRMHEFYGRCARCPATFVFNGALGDASSAVARGPRNDLGLYTGVRLRFLDRQPGVERWCGHGSMRGETPVLLIVEYPLDADGGRLEDDHHPGEFIHRIRAFPLEPFMDAFDLDAMFGEQETHPASAPPGDV